MNHPSESHGWFYRRGNQNLLLGVLVAACVAVLVAGLVVERHGHFGVDGWFGFYPLFGFVAYCFIVAAGWAWRRVVMRAEDYYER